MFTKLNRTPLPLSLSYIWNFGSLIGFFFFCQIVTGIFLSMFYICDLNTAFNSVLYIQREVNYGYILYPMHGIGASFVFIFVILHIGKALYYGSYSKFYVYINGMVGYIFFMLIAFLGYVLPWGQMSFWGVTVISSLFSVIPIFGSDLVIWLWGGFNVSGVTLSRFYSLHFLLPFILVVFIILHIYFLHNALSSNQLGLFVKPDMIYFNSYYGLKDIYGILLILIFFFFLVFYSPFYLYEVDNFIPANSLVTPLHIVPEWYFLFYYAILRCIPNKVGGVSIMALSILLFFLPPFLWINPFGINCFVFKIFSKCLFFLLTFNFIFLTYLGGQSLTPFIISISGFSCLLHFLIILVFIPLVSYYESKCIFYN